MAPAVEVQAQSKIREICVSSPAPSFRPLIAGNWKMNGLGAGIAEAAKVAEATAGSNPARADVMICPPATLLARMADRLAATGLLIGGQDCHEKAGGAHTGDISAEMLKDAGASAVIVGHSERRTDHGETDAVVRTKALAARRAGLMVIICVGETLGERRADLTLTVVSRQVGGSVPDGATAANTVIAYEPVWAIGTGLTPTEAEIAETHAGIRKTLAQRFGADGASMRILYGGSVKPDNAASILRIANVNGALVGGASLKAADFLAIVDAVK